MNVVVASSPGPTQNFLYVLIRAAYQFYVLLFTTAYNKQWQLQVSQQYFKSILPVPKQTLIPKFSILRTSRVPDDSLWMKRDFKAIQKCYNGTDLGEVT